MNTHGAGQGQGPVGNGGERRNQTPLDALRSGLNQAARPISRPKNTTGQAGSGSMNTHGVGQGSAPQQTRPAGGASNQQRPQQFQQTSGGNNNQRSTRGGGSPLMLIIIAAVLLLGGGGGLGGLFGGGDDGTATLPGTATTDLQGTTSTSSSASDLLTALLGGDSENTVYSPTATRRPAATATRRPATATPKPAASGSDILQQLLGGGWYAGQTGAAASASTANSGSAASSASANYARVDRTVASGSRSKYTTLRGGGKDTVTVMVYMCGADLESRSAMGTKDLQEMLNAQFGDNVRLIVYTGGSTSWRNNMVSSQVNQIWRIQNNKMTCLNQNAGTASMTNPDTLTSFIQYCAKNYSANRYALILWDHGSGSVSGYGYDEKNPRSGSMSLAGLNTAFQRGGVKFDFIGFDACLMATVENALMASKYADYLIASEETEPGIGWYYTNWLTALGSNPSMATLDIGKQIIDDFVATCSSQCRGQQTTLSIIDLAELEHTVPASFTAFSQSVSSMINNQEYKAVSNARNGSREFASSSRIDQVDLSDLCDHLGTQESAALAKALRSSVKYNRINNITNAYGLSVYFPYQKVSNVDKAVSTYEAIGLDSSYADAIRAFASIEASGQAVSGGGSAIPSLFGGGYASSSSSADMIGELLSAFLGGGSGMDFLSGRTLSDEALQSYLTANYLDASLLAFQQEGDQYVLSLPEDQWALINGADLNVFYDNGAGYVDLGLDNLFSFDEQGRMIADTDGTWVAINGQPVAYYHEDSLYESDDSWRISGRVPALLNNDRVDLMIVYDQDHENGYVAGARNVYLNGETDTVAKALTEIADGDTIVFLADLYDYSQQYNDSYELGDTITVSGALTVSDVYLPDASKVMATYRFTDLYNQAYWTPVLGR
ncbi:MAG: peptidase C11 [Clostridia bacterium]|nr:peptidase C11 [Clostridia bacterium]